MVRRVGRELCERRVRVHVEERAHDWHSLEVSLQDRGGLLSADFLDRQSLGATGPGELHLAGSASVADPADVAVWSDEPTPAVLDQDDRDRVALPRLAAADGEDVRVAAGSPSRASGVIAVFMSRRVRPRW
jgi:hypothetical protein